jgi:hypothetical protein
MSAQETFQQVPTPPHIIGLITGSIIGTGAGIINGITAGIEGSWRFGGGIFLATIIPFSIAGFLFDYVWEKIPVAKFNRKCWVYWAMLLPLCRILTDVLTPIFNGLDIVEYLLWQYSTTTVLFYWSILMAVFGLIFGYVFFQAYRFIFRQYIQRRHPEYTKAVRRPTKRMDRGRGQKQPKEEKKKRRFFGISLERGENDKEKRKKRKSKK